MTPEDEVELYRLTNAIRAASETVGDAPGQNEALQKAAYALILAFLQGRRGEIEDWYSGAGSPPLDPEVTVEAALFLLNDPEVVQAAIAKHPELRLRVEAGEFPTGSAGESIQKALKEARRREEAGNVVPLRTPGTHNEG